MLATLKAGSHFSATKLGLFVRNLILVGLPLLLVASGGLYWAFQSWIAEPERVRAQELSQRTAQQQASAVDSRLQELRQTLQGFSQQEALIEALQEDDRQRLNDLEITLRNEMPALQGLRLTKAGRAELDRDADTPIRFPELDMINRAERAQAAPAEASQVSGKWRLSLVQPVPGQASDTESPGSDIESPGKVEGVIFASLPLQILLNGIAEPIPGKLELIQEYPQQQPQVLLTKGEAAAGPYANARISGSYLQVRFTPSAALLQQVESSLLPFFAATLLILLAFMAAAWRLALLMGKAAGHAGEEDQLLEEKKGNQLQNLEVRDEDSELLGIRAMVQRVQAEDPLDIQDSPVAEEVPAEIFRAYDIRGLADSQLSPANVVLIGQAIGSEVLTAGDSTVVVARDGRTHSPEIAEQLIEGIMATGCKVINIGRVPTPVLYFACHELESTNSGVMVTASHNPPDYNGFKIVIQGETLKDEAIQQLRKRIVQRDFRTGAGKEDFADVSARYIERIFSDVALTGEVSVVVDAGNGVAGELAPRLFEELGCRVTPLFCDVDGRFPNHEPDPSVPANLKDLVKKVKEVQADLGIALDGDGDRVAVVTASGKIIAADRLLMMLARDIVARNPGADVIYDVKCSRELNNVISSYGGRPIMWKAGHSHMKAKMKETGALLGGELSGHIFIGERWYGFDDGLYAAARVMEIMGLREQDLDSILDTFPDLPATPEIKVAIPDAEKFQLVERLISEGEFRDGRKTTVDGLRVDYPKGWGLVRASNTSAALTLRFEAESDVALEQVKGLFRSELAKIAPKLKLNF